MIVVHLLGDRVLTVDNDTGENVEVRQYHLRGTLEQLRRVNEEARERGDSPDDPTYQVVWRA